MIRRLLARLIPGRPATAPRVFGPDAQPLRRGQLSRGATEVTRKLQQAGFKAFIVGGADGLTAHVLGEATARLAFGPQTWPHALARVMLAEQIYRAVSILTGAPYHHD